MNTVNNKLNNFHTLDKKSKESFHILEGNTMKKKKVKNRSELLEEHQKRASKMDWCDLAKEIISMEVQLTKIFEYSSQRDLKIYNQIIEIYEVEKIMRLKEE